MDSIMYYLFWPIFALARLMGAREDDSEAIFAVAVVVLVAILYLEVLVGAMLLGTAGVLP